ncbi:MAG: hypothetical protein IJI43_04710 [Bacilli bacterium]|nr:hypothetical protein [Bacilli bacterium]
MKEKQTKGKGLLTGTTVILALVVIICGWIGVSKIQDSYSMLSGGESPLLKSFDFKEKQVKQNDKLYFDIDYEYEGQGLSFISFFLVSKQTGTQYYFSTDNLSYIDLSNAMEYMEPGEYALTEICLFPMEWGQDQTRTEAVYSSEAGSTTPDVENPVQYFDFSDQIITVTEDNSNNSSNTKNKLTLDVKTKKAAIGEKIDLDVNYDGYYGIESMLLAFTNEKDNSKLNVYVKELYGNPNFIIPSNATIGNYKFNYAKVSLYSGEKELYRSKDKNLKLNNGKFQIAQKEFDPSEYSFNNEDYGDTIEKAITKLDNDAIITVNANSNPIISKSLFKLIKNTNKVLFIDYGSSEWVFNGSDIKKPKSVDVRTVIENIKDSTGYNKFIKKHVHKRSAMINFSNNGELPGKVLIKLDGNRLDRIIKDKTANIYYYNEGKKEFKKVAMEVQKNDGFYEFYIDHNSKYVVSSKKVKDSVVSKDNSMLELNTVQKDKDNIFNIYTIIALCAGGLLILIGIISLIVSKAKKKKGIEPEKVISEDIDEEQEEQL